MDHRSTVNRPRPPTPPPRIQRTDTPRLPRASRLPHPDPQPQTAIPDNCATVSVDQAIFTSLRSPTGEGYRIAAASAGVRPEEKAEINRQSPSHGSMTDETPGAVALLAYPVPTGRYCVSFCRHAGAEPTARGGQRVWTHMVLLDREAYDAFACNPLRVHHALRSQAGEPAIPPAGTALERMSLPVWDHVATPYSSNTGDIDQLLKLVSALLHGGRWVMAGTAPPAPTLEWAFEMIPLLARPRLAVSSKLSFSLARRLNLTVLGCEAGTVQHIIRGHDIRLRDLDKGDTGEPSAFGDWLTLIRNRAVAKHLPDIARLALHINAGNEPARLRRIAQLCNDIDAAKHADEPARAALRQRYASFTANSNLEEELLESVQACIAAESDDGQQSQANQSHPTEPRP